MGKPNFDAVLSVLVIVLVINVAAVAAVLKGGGVLFTRGQFLSSARPTAAVPIEELLYSYKPRDKWYHSPSNGAGLATATQRAQELIFEHQHPSSCANKTFLIIPKRMTETRGLGSNIHVLSKYLAVAMQQNRILVWEQGSGGAYFDGGCDFECLFEPLSSCTAAQAEASDHTRAELSKRAVAAQVSLVPTAVQAALKEAGQGRNLTGAFLKYWWRAQGAGFIARLNENATALIAALRKNDSMHAGYTRLSNGDVRRLPMPFPLPPGSINAHVRHGDKGIEMSLIPFKAYLAAAAEFVVLNPLGFKHSLFVSGEDPAVFAEAANVTAVANDGTTPDLAWTIYISDIPRSNDMWTVQLQRFGKARLTYLWVLQLLMALECDAFVGTRGSNWNRLIDELRCVWVSKCQSSYLEVGPRSDWAGYGWRR